MARLALFVLALLAWAEPARADDIAAAGRSVVRVVVIAFEGPEIVDFGHGSGFAVGPNRIVTNAHVVALALDLPDNVRIGIVPSQGSQAYEARILAIDRKRDLALLEMAEGSVPSIPLYVGPLDDGAAVAALGYPGNVDLATARSAGDYITPVPPTRSTGIFSNLRPVSGIAALLHTAGIARGHSGGPLLDQCGRVLGVNTLITRADEGDSPFFFAVANRELAAFLRGAGQGFATVASECVPLADRLREERELADAEARARQAELDAQRRAGMEARSQALARIDETREARLAIAILLLVLSLVAFGGAGIMLIKDRPRHAAAMGGAGLLLLVGAGLAFASRPSREDVEAETAAAEAPAADPDRFVGANVCRIVPERSRITVSSAEEVALDWSQDGCVNQRTQYARQGESWVRILVPNEEQTVTVAEFAPERGEYVVSRYLLDAERMAQARALRRNVELRACTADEEERALFRERQREIRSVLPRLPNERLVYRCEPEATAG